MDRYLKPLDHWASVVAVISATGVVFRLGDALVLICLIAAAAKVRIGRRRHHAKLAEPMPMEDLDGW